MKNIFAQSGEKAISLFRKHLLQTQVTLALFYFIVAACMLGISGEITRRIFIHRVSQQFEQRNTQEPPRPNPFESPREVREELRDITILVNSILLTIAGCFGYILAGITLKPLQESYEKEQQFLSNASHELRTPLAILRTTLENLKEKIPSTEKILTVDAIEEVDRMEKLLKNILMLSRAKEHIQKNEQINLKELIGEVVKTHQQDASKKNISIKQEDGENIIMQGNTSLIKRAIENIVENAVLYNVEEGTVTISIKSTKSSVSITITDTGIGMNEEDRSKSTERLYRAEQSRSRVHGGSGLGLSIVQEICTVHNGTLEIASIQNKGTSVTLTFPIHNAS